MGFTAQIELCFPKEKHARWAMHVAEELLRTAYAPADLPWVMEARKCCSLSARYLAYRQEAAALDLDTRYTALEWLRRFRTRIFIDRCQDIARTADMEDPEALFPQLLCAYILRFPQVPFTARWRSEMTVTGAIHLLRAAYDGTLLHVREKRGMRPMDEEDWSGVAAEDYAAVDGLLVKKT